MQSAQEEHMTLDLSVGDQATSGSWLQPKAGNGLGRFQRKQTLSVAWTRKDLPVQPPPEELRFTQQHNIIPRCAAFTQMPKKTSDNSFSAESAIEQAIIVLCTANHLPISRARLATNILLGRAVEAVNAPVQLQTLLDSSEAAPANIQWPQEKYAQAKESGEDIVGFLQRVWKDAISAGATRKDLRFHDSSAEIAVSHYLRPTRKFPMGRQLPTEVALPTLKEVNDRKLASGVVSVAEFSRLAQAARRRVVKAPT
jgi:hypothetical protein